MCSIMVCQEEFMLSDKLPVSLHWQTKTSKARDSQSLKENVACVLTNQKNPTNQKIQNCMSFLFFSFFWILAIFMQTY